MKIEILVLSTLMMVSTAVLADGVIKPSGNQPRFPKAYKEHLSKQTKPPSNNWLLDANDDAERFRRLQVVMSGTDIPMWELTYRYEEVYEAILKNNPEMGLYHWDKIRDRLNAAAMKRPARTQNIEGMFLESGVWQGMRDALVSKDPKKMREQFHQVRQMCIACHVAEKVGFLNDSSALRRTEVFPVLAK